MSPKAPRSPYVQPVHPRELTTEAIALTRRWLVESSAIPADASAQRLAGALKDPDGLAFTVGFVDGVIRPEDPAVAAENLRVLARRTPGFLPLHLRSAVALGGAVAPVAPLLVIPVARRALRAMVSHLVVDATDRNLARSIRRIKATGADLNINLLGEAILGNGEADRRLEGTRRLLARPDVDYVSIKVSSTVAPQSHWAFDAHVDHVVSRLAPLFRMASQAEPKKFINLDMEEYKDLDLTVAVFTQLLDHEEFRDLPAGIVLQAYLPDALSAMMRLQEWAARRTESGGAPIKVRVVKGANLPMERVEASLHGWPLTTWGTKQDTDTSYKSVLNYALTPERTANVRIGVAGHNLFDVALAHLLAEARGITDGVEFEMLLGMATSQAEAVRRTVGSLRLYTPVVHPREFDVAIAYLIRRLEEGASQENFMSAVFDIGTDHELFAREQSRFLASVAAMSDEVPNANRTQDRTRFDPDAELAEQTHRAALSTGGHGFGGPIASFENTPDTDPDLVANRAWGNDILQRSATSQLGESVAASSEVTTREQLDEIIAATRAASMAWGARTGVERSDVLHHMGISLEAHRAELLEVMAAECGKTLDQGDPEVSEAIDFAHYYAELAKELDAVEGARFVPSHLTVVTPPWNFPAAIPAGSTLAALATGSAVVLKPAPQARRTGAVLAEILWEALDACGVDRSVLALVTTHDEERVGRALVSHRDVDRVILTGSHDTAKLFRSFRADLPLLAETSGKNAIIVTPSADLDLAARDVVQSAFGHAGQKCSAASLVVLVGSVAKSERFVRQLVDAAHSLKVSQAWDPAAQMGPIIEPAHGKLLPGLTTLGEQEHWLLKPEQLDDSGRLWTPGIRTGVQRGSEYHLTEYFGPVLGIMSARTLTEAIDVVNEVDYGLTSGLHSLDPAEIRTWLDHVQAGNLYVNRGITGAVVRRQPFGGWKKSAIGPGTKAGGPNYLVGLGSWRDAADIATPAVPLPTPLQRLAACWSQAPSADVDWLESALSCDVEAWRHEFGLSRDVSNLAVERNWFRYQPVPATIRFARDTSGHGIAELLRVVGAAATAWRGSLHDAGIVVSSAVALPDPVSDELGALGITVAIEDDDQWTRRASRLTSTLPPGLPARIRLIGGDHRATALAVGGDPDVAVYGNDVVSASRVELLTFLREQSVTVTAHRFGTPSDLSSLVP